MTVAGGLVGLVLLYWSVMFIASVRGLPLVPKLQAVDEPSPEEPMVSVPVSVIIAAKEEQDSIARTMENLLRQTYGEYELIVVNDRSEDRTGAEAERVKAWAAVHAPHVPVKVVHIEELPDGWLGKNHALYEGVRQASGDVLLFTDADVVFRPNTIRSAIAFFRKHHVDHMTIIPAMVAHSFWLRGFVQFFLFSLGMLKWMWRPNLDDQQKEGMGIGAFNMLTRDAYERIGTMRALALRPDDDLELGMRVKRAGLRQRIVTGTNFLQVEWYPSLRAAVIGLEKNMFAGLKYQVWQVFAATAGQLLFFVWPFLAVWVLRGWEQAGMALAVLLMMTLSVMYTRRFSSYPGYEAVLLPVSALLLIYVLFRSSYLTLRRGGIYWRGTFYSLRELKRMYGGTDGNPT